MSTPVNIIGRSQRQQERVDRECAASGDLWGKIPILHEFKWTRADHQRLERAKRRIQRAKVILQAFMDKLTT